MPVNDPMGLKDSSIAESYPLESSPSELNRNCSKSHLASEIRSRYREAHSLSILLATKARSPDRQQMRTISTDAIPAFLSDIKCIE